MSRSGGRPRTPRSSEGASAFSRRVRALDRTRDAQSRARHLSYGSDVRTHKTYSRWCGRRTPMSRVRTVPTPARGWRTLGVPPQPPIGRIMRAPSGCFLAASVRTIAEGRRREALPRETPERSGSTDILTGMRPLPSRRRACLSAEKYRRGMRPPPPRQPQGASTGLASGGGSDDV